MLNFDGDVNANVVKCEHTLIVNAIYLQITCKSKGLKRSKQDSIPVGCVPPTSVVTTRCQYQWDGVGPRVTKFEEVSSVDHQMSVA